MVSEESTVSIVQKLIELVDEARKITIPDFYEIAKKITSSSVFNELVSELKKIEGSYNFEKKIRLRKMDHDYTIKEFEIELTRISISVDRDRFYNYPKIRITLTTKDGKRYSYLLTYPHDVLRPIDESQLKVFIINMDILIELLSELVKVIKEKTSKLSEIVQKGLVTIETMNKFL